MAWVEFLDPFAQREDVNSVTIDDEAITHSPFAEATLNKSRGTSDRISRSC